MKKVNLVRLGLVMTILIGVASCKKSEDKSAASAPDTSLSAMIPENGANADETSIATAGGNSSESRVSNNHFLYTESNEADVNRILIYKIKWDGSLDYSGAVESGGKGTGTGIGSQSALTFDKNHEWLFAVNAGSNTVSSFKVENDGGLKLAHTESSAGTMPNSVSVYGKLLYVLNHGSDNVHGFKIGWDGALYSIESSTQSLSGTTVDAPQVSFTPSGDWLIVTEKATNNISSFKVKNNGSIWPGVVTSSTGATPFGFDFARDNVMVVTNAAGGAAGAGSATAYHTGGNGKQYAINGAVADYQGAPCWVAVTEYGRFAFVSNTGSNSIASYYIGPGGRLYLVDKAAAAAGTKPADIVVAHNNYNVYALTANSNTIDTYHRTLLGGLKRMESMNGIPSSAAGLATY